MVNYATIENVKSNSLICRKKLTPGSMLSMRLFFYKIQDGHIHECLGAFIDARQVTCDMRQRDKTYNVSECRRFSRDR